MGTLHAIRRVDANGASDPDAGVALQLWSGSLAAGFRVATLHFKSPSACAAWGHGLYTLLHGRGEAAHVPPSVAMHSFLRRAFELHASPGTDRHTLEQASAAFAEVGQPVSPRILPILIQHQSPFAPPRSVETLTCDEFCRLAWFVKCTLVNEHVANSHVLTEALDDMAIARQSVTSRNFARFWGTTQLGIAYPHGAPVRRANASKLLQRSNTYTPQAVAAGSSGSSSAQLRYIGAKSVLRSQGEIEALNVVSATGPFQRPLIPPVIPEQADLLQMHSTRYRNPDQLPQGAVLVVGAGSSGGQIADELLRAGRQVA